MSRTGGWLSCALLALAAVIAPGGVSMAMAADVDPGDAVHIGSKQGYGGTGIFPIWSSGIQEGEPDYWAYCIEHDVPARTGVRGSAGDLDSYLGGNHFADPAIAGKALWVLAHSFPAVSLEGFGAAAGVPGISRNDAIEATQYAIWRYTDLDFDAAWAWETPDSEAAYWYLVNGANVSPGLTREDFQVTASVTAPSAAQSAGSLVGPFVVSTDQASVTVSTDPAVTVTDAAGNAVDVSAVGDGQELYLDLRETTAAGSATVRVTAVGSRSTGAVISVPNAPGGTATAEDHAQSMILVAPDTAETTGDAAADWSALPGAAEPAIGTSLVDAADGDRVLGWSGGTVIDTIAYQNLVPGNEYMITGELMRKSDGQSTGITGATTFTPAAADGSVEVSFVVPEGFAGVVVVAFEWLHASSDVDGEPIAVHTDIDDAAQTVAVETEASDMPTTPPTRGGNLAVTGSPAPTAITATAFVALLTGAILMRARRRDVDA